MLNQILIVFEAPPRSFSSMEVAARMIAGTDSSLHALCILDPHRAVCETTNDLDFNSYVSRCRQLMSTFKSDLRTLGIDISVSIGIGDIIKLIQKYTIINSISQVIIEYPFRYVTDIISERLLIKRLTDAVPCVITVVTHRERRNSLLH